MTFKEKLKKAFKSSSPSSSKNASPTISQSDNTLARWPSNVYRPDEPMPRPKYRAPVKKEHKEKLEAFSFGSAWRRRSHVSLYSPMGSRLPSRRASRVSRKSVSGQSGGRDSMDARRSVDARRKSFADKNGSASRNGSVSGQAITRPVRHSQRMTTQTTLKPEPEHDGDDDVANVGLSRGNSRERTLPPPSINVDSPNAVDRQQYFPEVAKPQPREPHDRDPAEAGVDRSGLGAGRGVSPTAAATGASTTGRPGRDAAPAASAAGDVPHGKPRPYDPQASPPKADSGPPSQHLVGGVDVTAKMFSEEELALALQRSGVSSHGR